MKKIIFTMLCLLSLTTTAFAANKERVKYQECIDGDTAYFTYKSERIKVRFLAIDTPETKHPTKGEEPFGKEASNYTCDSIKQAKNIYLEFDDNSDKKDKYNRYLAWVWVDDKLLQEELISQGLAKVAYLYGDYKYTDLLKETEEKARTVKIGIWSIEEGSPDVIDEDEEIEQQIETFIEKHKTILQIIVIVIIVIFLLISNKFRKKVIKKVKAEIRKF